MTSINRRRFVGLITSGTACVLSGVSAWAAPGPVPSYLRDYSALYYRDPRGAALQWFKDARFGLFLHYGLYSQLGRGEWVMLREKVPLTEYEKLQKSFNPSKFDADEITDCAIAAGMKYVNLTSKHHEGFCLFRTAETDYSSVASPVKRDLVGELAESCHKKGLGLFLYYSVAADWHHPYFCDPSAGWESFRPAYAEKPVQYRWQKDADTSIYIDYVRKQIRELLTQYGPIAGIWFDPVMGYYARPDLFPMQEIYAEIRNLQPACLISFKQGAVGTEDFAAPERHATKIGVHDSVLPERRGVGTKVAEHAWTMNDRKPMEICDTLQAGQWGYNKSEEGRHRGKKEVLEMLLASRQKSANLLLNTGPLPDGSIPSEDRRTLRSLRS